MDVETVRWCLRKGKGIRIIEPNENLARAETLICITVVVV